MKGSRQFWPFGGDEGKRFGEIVLAHEALEVCEGLVPRLGLAHAPVHEETDCQAAEQPQDQQPVAASDTTSIIVERHIQPLVASVLYPPTIAVGLEPLRG